MNKHLRDIATKADLSLLDYILRRINDLEMQTGIKRTLLAVCPNSLAVIRSALKSAKRCQAPIKFAATLNQVDLDGGYTGLTPFEFVKTIHIQARNLNVTSPVIIAVDHGGPWLKDIHFRDKWPYSKTVTAVKETFKAAIEAGYDMIHIDPTIDLTLDKGKNICIEIVAERTIELINFAENFRRENKFPPISYEVGTEEVHGGLADLIVFTHFLELLKKGLSVKSLQGVWPCFIVGKVGTDLHTSTFDPVVAKQLTEIAKAYGSLIKGHYSDNVMNPREYPTCGMGAANVGPEFTEMEYDGLMELENIQEKLYEEGKIAKRAFMKQALWNAVIQSGRWKKWLQKDESDQFYTNPPERQEWLIKTGCRYVWEDPAVISVRAKLYHNVKFNGIDPESIVESKIESAMDKYFYNFNLTGLNDFL